MKKVIMMFSVILLLIVNIKAEEEVCPNQKNINKTYLSELTIEDELELESWMFDESIWISMDYQNDSIEFELELEVESWMIDSDIWE